MKIIGVAGLVRSGKDTLAELLIENGWFGASLGDIVRSFARKRHAAKPDPISVANMTETATTLRVEHGSDFVLKEALRQFEGASKVKQYKGLVLFSVRAPIEADWILAHGGELIWVDAGDRVRFERDRKSRREGEVDIDFDEFKRQESTHWEAQPDIPLEAQMNVAYVKSKATKIIENNGESLEEFKTKALDLLKSL